MNGEHFDVIIVGSGVAGALVAFRLAQAKIRVLMLEAGGVIPDSAGREVLVNNYAVSPTKAQDSPYTDIINTNYYTSPEPVVAPQPLDETPPAGRICCDRSSSTAPDTALSRPPRRSWRSKR